MMNPMGVMELASAFYGSQVLFSAADAGVFAALADGHQATAPELADQCEANCRGMTLLLDASVALGLLEKEGDAYRNSAEAEAFLVPGRPGDLTRAIRYNRDVYQAWGQLPELVRNGKPVESPEIHLGDDADRTRVFVESMHARAKAIGGAVVPKVDLTDARRILDVGGGPGTYSVLLAQRYPELRCTVMDLPGVVAVAGELIAEQGMSDRVETLAGSYREDAFPGGNDAVLLFGMLHQESPESIRAILRKAYDALNPGGRVFVMDVMTDATHAKPVFSALFAVNMALTSEDGWVFSSQELRGWMTEAGFGDIEVDALPPPMPHWLATGRK